MFQKKGFKFQVSSFRKNGFTFIELVITIFVFVVGVSGVFLLAQEPIFQTQNSINRLTASFLAQEGIEIVRNIRDENWIDPTNPSWKDGLTTCSGGCEVDYNETSLVGYADRFLNFEDSSGFYGYGTGTQTKFKRKITITSSTDGDGTPILKVTVLIYWTEKGKDYKLEAQENLYPWWGN